MKEKTHYFNWWMRNARDINQRKEIIVPDKDTEAPDAGGNYILSNDVET